MRSRQALLAILAAALVVGLAGCSGSSTSGSNMMAVPEKGVETTASTADQPREIIRNADISVRVVDVRASVARAAEVATNSGGRVASERIDSEGDDANASLTLRVPAEKLDAALASIGSLGTVTSLNVTADDVTATAVDLNARIAALQTSVNRLNELLATAKTTTDLLAIEKELSARQAELDSLTAQRKALSEQVALSTVNVTLWPNSLAAGPAPPGFASGLATGWNTLRTVLAAFVTVAGFAIPFLLALLIIGVPVLLVVTSVRRRRRD